MQMLQHVANSTCHQPERELSQKGEKGWGSLQLLAKLQHLIDFHSTFIFGCDAAVATTVAQVFNDFGQV